MNFAVVSSVGIKKNLCKPVLLGLYMSIIYWQYTWFYYTQSLISDKSSNQDTF